jgi:membrane protein
VVAVRESGKALIRRWKEDQVGDLAAALTYYAIFALFPFALFVVSLTLLVLPQSVLRDGIDMLARAMPGEVAGMVREQANRFVEATSGGFAVFGVLLALWGASRGAKALSRTLNRMHDVRETRPWWKVQLVCIGVTLASSVLVLVALGLLTVGPWVGHFVADRFGLGTAFDTVWGLARWVGAALLMMLVWAILLYFLPNLKRPFRWVTPGAVVAVIFWLAASQLFALYVSNFGKYDRTYGALGAVIVALTWLWMTNLALLLGGEIDDTLDALRREKQGLPKVTKERETVERDLETRTGALSGTLAADEHKPSALAKRIGDGLGDLAKDHLELAKIEVGRSVKHGVMDGVAALLGGIVALIGFAMLCATAVVALEPLIEPLWLRMLLMSFVYLLAGGGIAAAFVHKLKEDVPPEMKRTRAQARRTVQALKQEIQHG